MPLTLTLAATEQLPELKLVLEHSLDSLRKWESIYEKPFFNHESKTDHEAISYIEQMVVTPNPPENFAERLTQEHYVAVNDYINSKQSATWFTEDPNQRPSREIVTAELIHHWMIEFGIMFPDAPYWPLNRLMNTIKVRSIKLSPPRKMSSAEAAAQQRALNERRRAAMKTSG